MTATFKGGHYSIAKFFGWTIAEHTYVGVDQPGTPTIWFDCYGGHTGPDNIYPDAGAIAEGNLRLAKAICCLDPNDTRTEFNRHVGGRLVIGDCSGLIYGVMGVCFNMANRILYSANSAPVMYPIGSALIYPIYGLYGKVLGTGSPLFTVLALIAKQLGISLPDTLDFAGYLAICKLVIQLQTNAKITKRVFTTALKSSAVDLAAFAEKTQNKALKLDIQEAANPDLPVKRMYLTIENALGAGFDTRRAAEIAKDIKEITLVKEDLDKAFYQGNISLVKHASMVNMAVTKALGRFESLLSTEEHKKLLGFAPGEHFTLIDPDIAAEVQQAL